jgi:hypothetical protein
MACTSVRAERAVAIVRRPGSGVAPDRRMTAQTSWDEVRRIRDEIQVQLHLAGMEARDRWQALQPKLVELEALLEDKGKRAGHAVAEQLGAMASSLRALRDELVDDLGIEAPR